jgi:hypothetical protein
MSKVIRTLKAALNIRSTVCQGGTWRWVLYVDF